MFCLDLDGILRMQEDPGLEICSQMNIAYLFTKVFQQILLDQLLFFQTKICTGCYKIKSSIWRILHFNEEAD